ncbi:DUF6481 family protein [uncultured Erythrobacter sp.]|uniref:DUF6481 family protein n=1 Tax=uncultured Erythrobacter sp. TaxID=263913 RepID=UPI002659B4AF|nr:DUF6481 family protein [uncultured Erythrobacter sp.]
MLRLACRQEKIPMRGFKEPSFQDRAAASSRAKDKALEKMKAAPQPDAAELAERLERRAKREALAAEKSEKARLLREEKQRLLDEKRAEALRKSEKADAPKKSEAEQKAARDARYAARKSRK